MNQIKSFLTDESGAAMAEYAVLLVIIATVAFTAMIGLRTAIVNKIDGTSATINAN